ncbi:MAG: choice-of-anchor tandem repeat GloVer-containing protein [Ginsengibacter sp.]
MKKILISIFPFLACMLSIQAQTLYGTTLNGGTDGGGTLNKFMPATNELTVLNSFAVSAANPMYTNLIQLSDGKLYGMTSAGGSNSSGTIFSYDPSTFHFTILKHLVYSIGTNPTGSLIMASDGKLYGLASGGGKGNGVIFSFDPSSNSYTVLKSFTGADGKTPLGSLVQASDGKLYGLTSEGGTGNVGVVFSFDPFNLTYTKLEDLNGTNGGNPSGNLLQGTDGKLYGMTVNGGSTGNGVIFSFDPTTSVYTKVIDFNNPNGADPYGSFIQGSDGKLYGTTKNGGLGFGNIFSFDPSTSALANVKSFDNSNNGPAEGAFPTGSLIKASDGKFYGLTSGGGATGNGVAFSYDLSNSTYTKLRDFDGPTGAHPGGSLIQATDGKLYGLTFDGAGMDFGAVFSYDLSASTYTKLKEFATGRAGSISTGLVKATDGKIYGTTRYGGTNGQGVLFSFDPSSSTYGELLSFTRGQVTGSLTQAANGKLYGMVSGGERFPYAFIFSFDPSNSTYSEVRQFDDPNSTDPTDGTYPVGNFIKGGDGKLYAMTNQGGNHGDGVIFSLDPSSSVYTMLYSFDEATGFSPQGSLVQATNGKFYGMTGFGGSHNMGVFFSFDPSSSAYVNLMDFDSTNGLYPSGGLIQATDGKLYGMTSSGGSNFFGNIFSYDPSSSVITTVKSFNYADGANPYGVLLQASDEKLYGTTSEGGINGNGVIFSYDPTSSTYTKLIDYNDFNGANPAGAFIEVPEGGPLPVTLLSFTGKNNGSNNQLSWKVANELNIRYYELQRSSDGQNFKRITQINVTGNSAYAYYDPITAAGNSLYYYRLKSVDKDGNFKFSEVIKIRKYHSGFAIVSPNPFTNRLVVNVESFGQDNATFILTDLSGKQLYKKNSFLSPGSNVVEINETGRLSKGTYLLTIIASQQTQSIKVIKGN